MRKLVSCLLLRSFGVVWLASSLAACLAQPGAVFQIQDSTRGTPVADHPEEPGPQQEITPYPTRPPYQPGELVDYLAQPGDTLPALAVFFNTSVEEIRAANPFIPEGATTMPPGMPMKIPIYYAPFWGSPYRILPDSQFVNGPAVVGFDTATFVAAQGGWLSQYTVFASGANRTGAQMVDLVALNYSLSPRLLLSLLEFQAGALSQPEMPPGAGTYTLGLVDQMHTGPYLQLVLAANTLNNYYYARRSGELASFSLRDGTLERPDPWQNTASVALQVYFARLLSVDAYRRAIGPDGLAATYQRLFGDPWAADQPHIPGSLVQPEFKLPFEAGKVWAFTGGPHTGWGTGEPRAALDFAPPSVASGCLPTGEWVTAVAAGVVARSEPGIVVLDLDGDGDERTGWVVFHLHIANEGRAPAGAQLQAGERLGHPSCEGGRSTGTHVHIARKYNGEWIQAQGTLAFNLEGWIAQNGSQPYLGFLTRSGKTVTACLCSNADSFIRSGD
jgi:LasA protease